MDQLERTRRQHPKQRGLAAAGCAAQENHASERVLNVLKEVERVWAEESDKLLVAARPLGCAEAERIAHLLQLPVSANPWEQAAVAQHVLGPE